MSGKLMKYSLLAGLALCVGCASQTQQVDRANDTEVTVSFDYRDLEGASAEMAQGLLSSPRIKATPEAPVMVAMGRLVNDTCQHVELDSLWAQLSEALLSDDRFEVSAAFAGNAANRDAMIAEARQVRGNAEFDAGTVQQTGQLRAPDISISGKLSQRNVRRDDGGTRIEYFLTMKATRLSDGVAIWQKSNQVIKAVAPGMPVW